MEQGLFQKKKQGGNKGGGEREKGVEIFGATMFLSGDNALTRRLFPFIARWKSDGSNGYYLIGLFMASLVSAFQLYEHQCP